MLEGLAFRLIVADADDAFEVEQARGREKMSATYAFEIEATTKLGDDELEGLLGADARLEITKGDKHRVFHGIAAQITHVAHLTSDMNVRRVRIDLVPRAFLMGLTRNSNIFQGCSVVAVVQRMLSLHGIPSRWLLTKKYPAHEYITQYEETDLAFVERLLAEAGILYLFEQPPADKEFDVAGIAGAAATAAIGAVTSAVAGDAGIDDVVSAAGSVIGWLGSPREIMVFSDNPAFYPNLSDGTSDEFEENLLALARAYGRQGLEAATGAVGNAIGGEAGEVIGDVANEAVTMLADELERSDAFELPMRHDADAMTGPTEAIVRLERRRRVHSLIASYRAYDPRRPQAPLEAEHRDRSQLIDRLLAGHIDADRLIDEGANLVGQAAGALGADQAVMDGIGAVRQLGVAMGVVGKPLELYRHHSRFTLPDWEFDRKDPERVLQGAQRDREAVDADSNCPWVSAGHRFALTGHPTHSYNQNWVVTSVEHVLAAGRGDDQPRVYSCHLGAVPGDVAYVPQVPARRAVQTCETATVVGSETITTNEHGEIRVRFHWDRRGSSVNSSCWIRVAQPWAGSGYGTQFIPRVGSEVIVSFDGGDPDRPLVIGSVYNAISPPSFALPERRTVSGIQTRSVPSGEGFNELSFDDNTGHEKVYIHAQKQLQIDVQDQRDVDVRHHDNLRVGRDRAVHVGGAERHEIGAGRETTVAENDAIRVDGHSERRIRGNASTQIDGNDALVVEGAREVTVRGACHQSVAGDSVTRVDGSAVCVVGAGGSHATHVEGVLRAFGSQLADVGSDGEVVLRCGSSSIMLSPERIVLSSPEIVISGEDRVIVAGEEIRNTASGQLQGIADKILLKSNGAGVALGGEAAVEGSRVLLNSPAQGSDEIEQHGSEVTGIELVDQNGDPVARHAFRIIKADGSTVSGALDEDGKAEVDLEEDAEIIFVGLSDVSTT